MQWEKLAGVSHSQVCSTSLGFTLCADGSQWGFKRELKKLRAGASPLQGGNWPIVGVRWDPEPQLPDFWIRALSTKQSSHLLLSPPITLHLTLVLPQQSWLYGPSASTTYRHDLLEQWFSVEGSSAARGHLVGPGDTVVTTWRESSGGDYEHMVGRDQESCGMPYNARDSPPPRLIQPPESTVPRLRNTQWGI